MTSPIIRPLQPGDLLAGRGQPKRELFLSPDGISVQARPPSWTTFLPWVAPGCGLVYETDSHGPALVYACSRHRRDRWDVVYLGGPIDMGEEELATIWQTLLERLCQQAGRQGVLRVFARVDDSAVSVDTFRQAGFVVYSRDVLWERVPGTNTPQSSEPAPATSYPSPSVLSQKGDGLRPQSEADAWGLHDLYRSLAPSLVQQSEGLTSRDWLPPGRRWFGDGPRGYVLIVEGQVKGHLCLGEAAGHTRLRLLAHPNTREAVGALLGAGLTELSVDPAHPITVLVPEYGNWMAGLLEQAGFRSQGTQCLLVRHTVAWAPVREPRRRPVMKEALEPAPTTPATSAANGEHL